MPASQLVKQQQHDFVTFDITEDQRTELSIPHSHQEPCFSMCPNLLLSHPNLNPAEY